MTQNEDIKVEKTHTYNYYKGRDQQDRRSYKLLISHKPTQNIHFILGGQGEERINISALKEGFAANP